jgi:peptide-methionine (S)-S-oxide reductase
VGRGPRHALGIPDSRSATSAAGWTRRTLVEWRRPTFEPEATMASRRWVILAAAVGLAAVAAASFGAPPTTAPFATAARSTAVPAPSLDLLAVPRDGTETAVLAGGCFWGVQGVYQHVKGVSRAESGYVGGSPDTADYESVTTGTTGHAESVRITYDPAQVTYGQILHIFFSVVHDPTQLNRQGPDTGSQYRSAIFAQNAEQQRVATAYVAQLTRKAVFPSPIFTEIVVNTDFYAAEAYHQDFLNSNPTYPYIVVNDLPKVDDLKQSFPQLYRDQPVLIGARGP